MERLGFSPKEVAAALGVNPKTIYGAIREGQIRALHIGKRLIVTKPVLDQMLNEGTSR